MGADTTVQDTAHSLVLVTAGILVRLMDHIMQPPPAGYPKEAEKGYIEDEISFLKDQLKTLEGRLAEKQDDE